MGYIDQDQDGVGLCTKKVIPIWMRTQSQDKNPTINLKLANKMRKLVVRGYITEGVILALPSFFSVSKGTEYIRMVFDATVIRFNNYLWASNFMLLSMVSLLMMVGPKIHMVNLDVEGMFHIFRIYSELEKYCGVDLGSYLRHKEDQKVTPLWMLWVRLIMGPMLFPYDAIKGLLWATEVLRRDRSDPDNPFR